MPANGWFEWARTDDGKQPYFIYHRSRQPLFFAAIGKAPLGQDHSHEGFFIVTVVKETRKSISYTKKMCRNMFHTHKAP